MSDFLSQFDKTTYKKEENKKEQNLEKNVNRNNVEVNISASKKEEKKISGIASTEHETVIDTTYNKSKIIRYAIICGTVLAVCIIGFIFFRILNRVTVKNFVGNNIGETKTWGLKNKIEFDITYEFSIEQDSDKIISQDVEEKSKIQKGSIIYVVVSKGADPEELVTLPDFSELTTEQVRNWIKENKTQSVTVMQEYSDTVEKNKFIKMEFRDTTVDATNFKRKDGLVIYMSKGVEVAQKNIIVPDFTGKMKTEVEIWAAEKGIKVTYTEKGSDKILETGVISQSVTPGEYLAKNDEIKIDISIGKGVKVPDFNTVSMNEAPMYNPELVVTVKTKYSDTAAYGQVISQSVKKGTTLYGDKKKVEVVYSEGRPYIDDLTMKTEKELAPYFYEFTSKGANVTYNVTYIDSLEPKGKIVSASKGNEFINMNEHIEIQISIGS